METPINDTVESYRKAELRLRQVLLGDGVDTPGLVKGEDLRFASQPVTFGACETLSTRLPVPTRRTHVQHAEERLAGLEEELRMLVSGWLGKAAPARSATRCRRTDDSSRGSTGPQSECELDLQSGQKGEIRGGEADGQQARSASDSG